MGNLFFYAPRLFLKYSTWKANYCESYSKINYSVGKMRLDDAEKNTVVEEKRRHKSISSMDFFEWVGVFCGVENRIAPVYRLVCGPGLA